MTVKSAAAQPRMRSYCHLSLLVALFFNTGNAFIPLRIPSVSAMSSQTSDTAYSGSGSASKPLNVAADAEESQTSKNSSGEGTLPALPEASGEKSIPTIKLGGTQHITFSLMHHEYPFPIVLWTSSSNIHMIAYYREYPIWGHWTCNY